MRRFRLIDEYETGKKGNNPNVSWGLTDPDDRSLTEWNCMIVGPYATKFDRLYSI